jgi:hypothetical protein
MFALAFKENAILLPTVDYPCHLAYSCQCSMVVKLKVNLAKGPQSQKQRINNYAPKPFQSAPATSL